MQEILNFDLTPYLQALYDNINFENVIKFMIIYFFIIRISLIIWVIKDIINRSSNVIFQLFCILIITLGTPLAVFIYLLVRPGKTLYERYQEEVEENLDIMQEMIEDKYESVGKKLHCFSCDYPILPEFQFCPTCKIQLKTQCKDCNKTIYNNWEICPYCWEEHEPITEKREIKKVKKETKIHSDKKEDVLELVNELKKSDK